MLKRDYSSLRSLGSRLHKLWDMLAGGAPSTLLRRVPHDLRFSKILS
jgi:hypothetical protein